MSPAGGTVTYSWSVSGNASLAGSVTGSSVSATAGAPGSFSLVLNGVRNGIAFTCSKSVTVAALPGCSISGPDPVDENSPGHVYAGSVTPAAGTVTYLWSIAGNGAISGSNSGSAVTVDAGAAGSFLLTLDVTRDGCPGTCNRTVTVASSGTPAATILVQDFQFLPPQVLISTGQTVKWQWVSGAHTTTSGFSSDPAHAPGALWSASIDSLNPAFEYRFDSPGYFPFFCVPHELSGMRGAVVVGATVGLGDSAERRPRLLPTPNPFPDRVHLLVDLDRAERVTIDIFDLNGRKVLGLLIADLPPGTHRVAWGGWDEHHQPVVPGVYFARLTAGDGYVSVQKLFKMR